MNELRRRQLVLAGALLGAAPLYAAPRPGKVYRVGVLITYLPAGGLRETGGWPAFLDRMRGFGFVENENLQIVIRSYEGKRERLPELAAELASLNLDVVAAIMNPPLLALQRSMRSTPIVMMSHAAVPVGLVSSLSHPGANITGVDTLAPELDAKRLQLLREVVPSVTRIAAIYNPAGDPAMLVHFQEAEKAARTLGCSLRPIEVRRNEDVDAVLAALARERPDALITFTDDVTGWNWQRIPDFALTQRLPSVFEFDFFVDGGGLMSYGPTLDDIYRRAAGYVHRILEGAKPADLPVEYPTRFELVLNLKTARALGVTIPQSMLLRADRVIQ